MAHLAVYAVLEITHIGAGAHAREVRGVDDRIQVRDLHSISAHIEELISNADHWASWAWCEAQSVAVTQVCWMAVQSANDAQRHADGGSALQLHTKRKKTPETTHLLAESQ